MKAARLKPWLIGLAVLAALWLLRRSGADAWLQAAFGQLQGLGPWGWALFIGLYALACVALLPASVLTLGAGAVYGLGLGFALVSLASTLGATLAFLLGRGLLRGWVLRRLQGQARLSALDRAMAQEGFKITALLRLSPLVPFNVLNYALGLSPVRLGDYVLASWLGMMPGTLLYVYLGTLAGELGAGPRQRTALEWAALGLGLAATLALSLLAARIAKRALAQAAGDAHGL